MDPEQFRKDKEIDPSQLEVECIRHADRTHFYGELLVEAEIEEERAKFKMGLTEARLEAQCRQKPHEFSLAKITDSSVRAAVKIHPDMITAYDQWVEARRKAKLLAKAVKAMDDKKRMLQGLITLHGQQYFAGPSVPRDILAAWKEHREGVEGTVNTLQKKKTRTRTRRRS